MAQVKIIYPDTSKLRTLTDAQPEGEPDHYWDVAHHGKDLSAKFPDQYHMIYACTMEGEPGHILSQLWERFNIGDRGGLRVRSMSVGDVVEIDGQRHVCKPAGWEKS